jgi:hypothetical protein
MNDLEMALSIYDGNGKYPYCDFVYRALKDLQRLRTGCAYCRGEKCLGYDQESDGIRIVNVVNLWGIESDTWEFEIDYCPICGKDLRT